MQRVRQPDELPPPQRTGCWNAVVGTYQLPPEVRAGMGRGTKIEAIRLLRERTGMDLKDAQEAVEVADPGRLSVAAQGERGDPGLSASVVNAPPVLPRNSTR